MPKYGIEEPLIKVTLKHLENYQQFIRNKGKLSYKNKFYLKDQI
jgi:hypothetical protein